MSNQQPSKPYINHTSCEEMLSAKTFDLKKRVSNNCYILSIVPTLSQIVANAPANKAVIPEVLNYLRYTAAIRALQYNCVFVHKAIRAKTDEDFNALTDMSFSYKGSVNNGIRCANPRVPISAKSFYFSALNVLDDSKQIVQNFEDMLLLDKLSNIIPDFDKKMADTIRLKNKYIAYADKIAGTILNDKNALDNFINHVSSNCKTTLNENSK